MIHPRSFVRSSGAAALCVALLSLSACDESFLSIETRSTSELEASKADKRLVWTACSEGELSFECASTTVPEDWEHPSGRQISLSVRRHRAAGTAKGEVWFLAGGPAYATRGAFAELIGSDLGTVFGSYDLYIPDYRGVGESTHLDCQAETAPNSPGGTLILAQEVSACVASVERQLGAGVLRHMTMTQSAHDLRALLARRGEKKGPVTLWGASYGTLFLQRFLSIYPNPVDGVALLGVVAPRISNAEFPKQTEAALRAILGECAGQTECRARLGGDPLSFLEGVLKKVAAGHCPTADQLDSSDHAAIIKSLVEGAQFSGPLLPAFLKRVDRCNASDATVIMAFARTLGLRADPAAPTPAPTEVYAKAFSSVLYSNLVFSEMWDSPPKSAAAYEDDLRRAGLHLPDSIGPMAEAAIAWPRYPHDEHYEKDPSTRIPVLMLNGTWDANTPIEGARKVAKIFNHDNQHLVEIPRGGHGPLATACGRELFTAFVADPKAKLPRTTCPAEVVDFINPAPETVTLILGSPINVWE